MSETKDPISIPEGQVKDTTTDTTSREQQNLSVFTVPYPSLALITPIAVNLESVPRSAAGAVNDAGDALDDGNPVSSAGYVISSTSDVLGKTMPLGQEKQGEEKQEEQPAAPSSHDEAHGKYATQPANKPPGGRGPSSLKDIVDGVTGAVGNTVDAVGDTDKSAIGDVTGGLGLGGKSDETLETPKQAEEAKDQVAEVKTENQKGTTISLEGRGGPTGNKEAALTQDKPKKVRPKEAKDKTSKAEDLPEDVMEQKPENITPKVDEKSEIPEGEIPESEAFKSNTSGEEVLNGEASGDEEAVSKAPGSEALKSMAPGEEAAGEWAE
ncbi:hypothetical protein FOVG_16352 [Fusarium oxysporum f. sp. pisi HDV247]|uniref:Uncharacterized protein n=1 Tax=Fusarium oxysporum f. sp. pisi HDV247 TaxID=1080344 RepID=W9NNX8_FUSOX|nr:hypothetical protein FOVG_16352 [Fusarium oxysporum f. sp. pisi HDV247]